MYRRWWWDRRPRVRTQEFIREPPQKKKTKTKPVGRWLAELMGCSAQRQQLAAAAWPSLSCKSAAVQDTAAHSGSTAVRRRTTLPGKAFEKWQPPAAAPIVITSCSLCSESKGRKAGMGTRGALVFSHWMPRWHVCRLISSTSRRTKLQLVRSRSRSEILGSRSEKNWWQNSKWVDCFVGLNVRHPDKN